MTEDRHQEHHIHPIAEELAQIGASEELVAAVIGALSQGKIKTIARLLEPVHAADIADLIMRLESDDRKSLVDKLKRRISPDVLYHLDDKVKDEVLEIMGADWIASKVHDLDTDDAVQLIEDMDKELQEEVLAAIPAQDRAIIQESLSYHEDSAGRLMQREVVCVPTFWTIEEALEFVRESKALPDTFYDIVVVDPKHHPVGVIPLDRVVRNADSTPVSEIMITDVRMIPVSMDQEEVALLFRHYDLLSAPVIDESGRIVGMITVDDIVPVIEEMAEEDILHLAGLGESDFTSNVSSTSMSRSPWLAVTLINSIIASIIIFQFEAALQEIVALPVLMVIVAAMGGNAGMQTVTVIVRALATRELRSSNFSKSARKEVMVSSVTGIAFSLLVGSLTAFWFDIGIAIILAISVICNMIWSAFAGSLLPMFVQRLGLDPAISAGPLLSTTTDIVGYVIFLGLASLFLL